MRRRAMPSAPSAAPSNITVVPPSGTVPVGPNRIQPERPYPRGPKAGMVRTPVKPLIFQTTELSFWPSYFANRYVNVPKALRSIVVLGLPGTLEIDPVAEACGNEPNRLVVR